MPPSAASSSPTLSSSSALHRTASCSPTKSLRRTHRVTGPPASTSPVARSLLLISSSFVTTLSRSSGTNGPPPPPCRTISLQKRNASTWMLTACSPAKSSIWTEAVILLRHADPDAIRLDDHFHPRPVDSHGVHPWFPGRGLRSCRTHSGHLPGRSLLRRCLAGRPASAHVLCRCGNCCLPSDRIWRYAGCRHPGPGATLDASQHRAGLG